MGRDRAERELRSGAEEKSGVGGDSDTVSPQTEVTLRLVGATKSFRNYYQCPQIKHLGRFPVLPTHLAPDVLWFVLGCCSPVSLSRCLSQMTITSPGWCH